MNSMMWLQQKYQKVVQLEKALILLIETWLQIYQQTLAAAGDNYQHLMQLLGSFRDSCGQ